jgi:hypothetical protein
MPRCEWYLRSHKHEGANVWHNAIGSVPQPWQLVEHIDDGRRAKCSLARCHRFALERHENLMEEECHVAMKSVKAPAEALGWSLTLGREACLVFPMTKSSPKRVLRGLVKLSTISYCSTGLERLVDLSTIFHRSTAWKVLKSQLCHISFRMQFFT